MLDYVRSSIPKASRATLGPIILQHDFAPATVEYQRRIIKSLQAKGYSLVSMKECLGIEIYQARAAAR